MFRLISLTVLALVLMTCSSKPMPTTSDAGASTTDTTADVFATDAPLPDAFVLDAPTIDGVRPKADHVGPFVQVLSESSWRA